MIEKAEPYEPIRGFFVVEPHVISEPFVLHIRFGSHPTVRGVSYGVTASVETAKFGHFVEPMESQT